MAELIHMFGVTGLLVIFATVMAMLGRFAWHQRQQINDHDAISRTGFTLTVLRGGGGKTYFPHPPCGGGYTPRRPDDDHPDDAA